MLYVVKSIDLPQDGLEFLFVMFVQFSKMDIVCFMEKIQKNLLLVESTFQNKIYMYYYIL